MVLLRLILTDFADIDMFEMMQFSEDLGNSMNPVIVHSVPDSEFDFPGSAEEQTYTELQNLKKCNDAKFFCYIFLQSV